MYREDCGVMHLPTGKDKNKVHTSHDGHMQVSMRCSKGGFNDIHLLRASKGVLNKIWKSEFEKLYQGAKCDYFTMRNFLMTSRQQRN